MFRISEIRPVAQGSIERCATLRLEPTILCYGRASWIHCGEFVRNGARRGMTRGGARTAWSVAPWFECTSMKLFTVDDETSAPNLRDLPESRGALLREASEAIGARWVLDYSASVQQSGRRIEGGWPGTLPEARSRVLASLPQELSSRGAPPLSPQELVVASAAASAEAKRRWRVAAKRPASRTSPGKFAPPAATSSSMVKL